MSPAMLPLAAVLCAALGLPILVGAVLLVGAAIHHAEPADRDHEDLEGDPDEPYPLDVISWHAGRFEDRFAQQPVADADRLPRKPS